MVVFPGVFVALLMVGDVSGGLVAAILLIVSTPPPPTPPPT